jgi:hypothetical protein
MAHTEAVKIRARAMVAMAIREGLIDTTKPCVLCGAAQRKARGGDLPYVVQHHPNYDRPLFVRAVCRPCHGKIHGGGMADPWSGEATTRPTGSYWLRKSEGEAEWEVIQAVARRERVPFMPKAVRAAALARLGLTEGDQAAAIRMMAPAAWQVPRIHTIAAEAGVLPYGPLAPESSARRVHGLSPLGVSPWKRGLPSLVGPLRAAGVLA